MRIKFRQWQNHKNKSSMIYFEVGENRILNHNQILPSPTMIFIGMQDDNNKDIYEDDIVKIEINLPFFVNENKTFYCTVSVSDGESFFDFQNHGEIHYCNMIEKEFDIESIEVVGNIYEYPEMFDLDKGELLIK